MDVRLRVRFYLLRDWCAGLKIGEQGGHVGLGQAGVGDVVHDGETVGADFGQRLDARIFFAKNLEAVPKTSVIPSADSGVFVRSNVGGDHRAGRRRKSLSSRKTP